MTEASERLMRLRFEHELDDSRDGQLRITQRVQMTGLATPLMRRTIGPRLERSIPVALANLVELAKSRPGDRRGLALGRCRSFCGCHPHFLRHPSRVAVSGPPQCLLSCVCDTSATTSPSSRIECSVIGSDDQDHLVGSGLGQLPQARRDPVRRAL